MGIEWNDKFSSIIQLRELVTNQHPRKKYKRFERKMLHTVTGAISRRQNRNPWRRRTNKEFLTQTGQSISYDVRERRLTEAGHVARSNSS